MAQAKLYVQNYTSGSNVPGYYGEENVTYRVNADSITTQSGNGSLETTWTVEVTGIDIISVFFNSVQYGSKILDMLSGEQKLSGKEEEMLGAPVSSEVIRCTTGR